MKSVKRGKSILSKPKIAVTNISSDGFWVWLQSREYFLPFKKFPWFKDATIGQIIDVRLPSAKHLFWPKLDVDLHLDSIVNTERYPLIAK